MRDVMKAPKKMRADALAIFHDAVQAVDPFAAVHRAVTLRGARLDACGQGYDLTCFRHVYIVGAGKAGAKMALAMEEILGDRLTAGVINVKYEHGAKLSTVKVNEAGHPVPDEAGIRGTAEIIELLQNASETDLVFCLLSGGGSALLALPAEGLTLRDKQAVTGLLLKCGATIHEINTVRKHLSRVKGGRLAKVAYPATVLSLVLSDVIGDDLKTIASGPTVPDDTRFGDCIEILEKYALTQKVPAAVRAHLKRGALGEVDETPGRNDPVFAKNHTVIVGNNLMALEAAAARARDLGYRSLILSSSLQGETREVAGVHASIAREILNTGNPVPRPACVISGGETTVTVRGQGRGGRNQEFALAAALDIDGLDPVVILSGGTDGTDGPTDAAGALADGSTVQRARAKNLDPRDFLRRNDSYLFFQRLGDLLVTGPTYTNVMDLRLVLVG